MIMFVAQIKDEGWTFEGLMQRLCEDAHTAECIENGLHSDAFKTLLDSGVVTSRDDGSYTIGDANYSAFKKLLSAEEAGTYPAWMFGIESMDPEESYIGVSGAGTDFGEDDRVNPETFFDKKDADEYYAIPFLDTDFDENDVVVTFN